MAVLIEGINRPTEPRKCKFFDIDPLGVRKPFCVIKGVCDGLKSCLLIELQKHGRLIDAEALKLQMLIAEEGEINKYCYPCKEVFAAIDNAPTVIDESGEE